MPKTKQDRLTRKNEICDTLRVKTRANCSAKCGHDVNRKQKCYKEADEKKKSDLAIAEAVKQTGLDFFKKPLENITTLKLPNVTINPVGTANVQAPL